MHILTDMMWLFGRIPNTVEAFFFFSNHILFSFHKAILVKESALGPQDKWSRGQIIKYQINVQFVLIVRSKSLLTAWQQNASIFYHSLQVIQRLFSQILFFIFWLQSEKK